jgi:excinuclease ABC subunit A
VIKTADWIIDLGPEGGAGGGRVLVAGTPETVAATPGSYTGQFLAPHLASKAGGRRKTQRIPLLVEADKPKPPRRKAKA